MKSSTTGLRAVYWTALIGLFFDYYDLYLFVYLEKVLAGSFGLSSLQSNVLQFTGLAGVGAGAMGFGYLADRFGRTRLLLAVFGVYVIGIAGLSLAWSFPSLLGFRLLASLALGAEWGIGHALLAERVSGAARYRYSALLQFALLGGLLAALASKFVLPIWGWRWLFAASLVPVILLSLIRWRALVHGGEAGLNQPDERVPFWKAIRANAGRFVLCFAVASLTIASGTVNVFIIKELPQGVWVAVVFWSIAVPGMLLGSEIVRRAGVGRALLLYALGLMGLSVFAGMGGGAHRSLVFALGLSFLNGIPFGLMGAYFNEAFGAYRTLLSGAAYNLGRILAGFSPVLITALGLHQGGRYFLFTGVVGAGVLGLGWIVARQTGAEKGR